MASQTYAVYVRDSKNEGWRHYTSNLTKEGAEEIAKRLARDYYGVQASSRVDPPPVVG